MWAPHEYDNFGGSRAVFPTWRMVYCTAEVCVHE
jgi:hypothetical protein